MNTKSTIREMIRARRQQLSATQQSRYADCLVEQFAQFARIRAGQHVAVYLAQDNELNLAPLIESFWQAQINTYLPVLRPMPPNRLWFSRYDASTKLLYNRFGIAEPDRLPHQHIPVSSLDWVLFPLVAFDQHKQRLGMGGGFYDRTFAHLNGHDKRPRFIGLAYPEQEVELLPAETWDIPLDWVITPETVFE